jgi:hypothetical protein
MTRLKVMRTWVPAAVRNGQKHPQSAAAEQAHLTVLKVLHSACSIQHCHQHSAPVASSSAHHTWLRLSCSVPRFRLLQLPNGEMTSEQMRYAASCIRPYGEEGCADITTRANLQLRGVKLDDAGQWGIRARSPGAARRWWLVQGHAPALIALLCKGLQGQRSKSGAAHRGMQPSGRPVQVSARS